MKKQVHVDAPADTPASTQLELPRSPWSWVGGHTVPGVGWVTMPRAQLPPPTLGGGGSALIGWPGSSLTPINQPAPFITSTAVDAINIRALKYTPSVASYQLLCLLISHPPHW